MKGTHTEIFVGDSSYSPPEKVKVKPDLWTNCNESKVEQVTFISGHHPFDKEQKKNTIFTYF